jgi:hypothetical protein
LGESGTELDGGQPSPTREDHILQVVNWTAEAIEVLAERLSALERRVEEAPAGLERVGDAMRLAMLEAVIPQIL